MPLLKCPTGTPKIANDALLKRAEIVDDPTEGECALKGLDHVVCACVDVCSYELGVADDAKMTCDTYPVGYAASRTVNCAVYP